MKTKLLRKIRKRYLLRATSANGFADFDRLMAYDTWTKKLKSYLAGHYDHSSFWVQSTDYTAVQVFVQMEILFGRRIVLKNKRKLAKRLQLTKARRLFKNAVSGSALLLIFLSACGSVDTQGDNTDQKCPIQSIYDLGIERGRYETLKELHAVAADDSLINAKVDSLIKDI